MDYIQRIRQLIALRGISHKELGERIGLKKTTMSRLLSGKQEPKLMEAYGLARELGVTLNDLVDETPVTDQPVVGQMVRITQDDLCLLKVARSLGVDVALARMVHAPSLRPPTSEPNTPSDR